MSEYSLDLIIHRRALERMSGEKLKLECENRKLTAQNRSLQNDLDRERAENRKLRGNTIEPGRD